MLVDLIAGSVDSYDFLEKLVLKKPSADVIGSRQGEKIVGCFEANKSIKNDRNRIRKRQRFCVVQCEDLKVLYYREHNMRSVGKCVALHSIL